MRLIIKIVTVFSFFFHDDYVESNNRNDNNNERNDFQYEIIHNFKSSNKNIVNFFIKENSLSVIIDIESLNNSLSGSYLKYIEIIKELRFSCHKYNKVTPIFLTPFSFNSLTKATYVEKSNENCTYAFFSLSKYISKPIVLNKVDLLDFTNRQIVCNAEIKYLKEFRLKIFVMRKTGKLSDYFKLKNSLCNLKLRRIGVLKLYLESRKVVNSINIDFDDYIIRDRLEIIGNDYTLINLELGSFRKRLFSKVKEIKIGKHVINKPESSLIKVILYRICTKKKTDIIFGSHASWFKALISNMTSSRCAAYDFSLFEEVEEYTEFGLKLNSVEIILLIMIIIGCLSILIIVLWINLIYRRVIQFQILKKRFVKTKKVSKLEKHLNGIALSLRETLNQEKMVIDDQKEKEYDQFGEGYFQPKTFSGALY